MGDRDPGGDEEGTACHEFLLLWSIPRLLKSFSKTGTENLPSCNLLPSPTAPKAASFEQGTLPL